MTRILKVHMDIDGSSCNFDIAFEEKEFDGKTEQEIDEYIDMQILEYIRNNAQLDYDINSMQTSNICPVCGVVVCTASPNVTEENGTKTHLECWYKK